MHEQKHQNYLTTCKRIAQNPTLNDAIALLLGETMTQDLELAVETYNRVGIEEPRLAQLERDIEFMSNVAALDSLSMEQLTTLANRNYGPALNHLGTVHYDMYLASHQISDLDDAIACFEGGASLNHEVAIDNLSHCMMERYDHLRQDSEENTNSLGY